MGVYHLITLMIYFRVKLSKISLYWTSISHHAGYASIYSLNYYSHPRSLKSGYTLSKIQSVNKKESLTHCTRLLPTYTLKYPIAQLYHLLYRVAPPPLTVRENVEGSSLDAIMREGATSRGEVPASLGGRVCPCFMRVHMYQSIIPHTPCL